MNSFKENIRRLLARQGWFLRKSLGLPAGTDFEHDFLVRASLPQPKIVFDVGAHHGETCEHFSRIFPQASIFSFEPVAGNFAVLEKRVRGLTRIACHQLALGEHSGEISIVLQPDSQGHSLRHRTDDTMARREIIHVTTLDAFAARHSVPAIDLLKIDTEGYELAVLQGAKDLLACRRIGPILLEASLDPHDTAHTAFLDAVTFLRPHGYKVAALYDQVMWRQPVRLAYFNALFVPSHPSAAGK